MKPGVYTLRIVPPGLLPAEVSEVEVLANEVSDVGVVRCEGGGAATGRLVDDATGEGFRGSSASPSRAMGAGLRARIHGLTVRATSGLRGCVRNG